MRTSFICLDCRLKLRSQLLLNVGLRRRTLASTSARSAVSEHSASTTTTTAAAAASSSLKSNSSTASNSSPPGRPAAPTAPSPSPSSSPPPTAPKATLNLKHIRENAELYAQNCIDRNYAALAENPLRIRSLADEAVRLQHALREPRAKIKRIEKEIGRIAFQQRNAAARSGPQNSAGPPGVAAGEGTAEPSSKTDPDQGRAGAEAEAEAEAGTRAQLSALHAEARRLKDETEHMTLRRERCVEDMQRLALSLPNLTSPETPVGDEPRLVGYINFDPANPPEYVSSDRSLLRRSHVAIGTELGLLDFTSSATTTGWGWYYLTNEGALLEQALVQYALSVAMRRGWRAVSPPSIVYGHIAEACGFQPRDQHNEQQVWAIEQSERDRERGRPPRVLAGTAEIPLAAMYAGRDIPAADLPIRLVGASRCYRAEAGARGVDTKGLYRVHEFTKVEMFGWADALEPASSSSSSTTTTRTPDVVTSTALFDEMLSIQSEILASLNLPCRILEMPSTDLGASAARKRDIEALFPSRLHRPAAAAASTTTTTTTTTTTAAAAAAAAASPAIDIDAGWGEVTSASICTDYQSRRLGTRVRADGGAKGGAGRGAPSSSSSSSRFPHTVNGTALAVPRVIAAILENGWDERAHGVVVPAVLRPFMGGVEVISKQT